MSPCRSAPLLQKFSLWRLSELPRVKAMLEEKGLTWADVGAHLEMMGPGRLRL